jgi:hypothetical protein
VVPYWNDKDLLLHASKKAEEVRNAKLSYVADSFTIAVLTEDDFAIERQQLANFGLQKFEIPVPTVRKSALERWIREQTHNSLIVNLRRKAALIGAGKPPSSQEKFERQIVTNYIAGQVVLGELERRLPETFERVRDAKAQRESNLEGEYFAAQQVPARFFNDVLAEYRTNLGDIAGVASTAIDALAREAVADWLLRCPMEFD